MKGLKTTKRLIAAVLSFVMILGILPVIPLTVNAADEAAQEVKHFVSLPITIRDFPADGMLFEYNETYDKGTGNYAIIGGEEEEEEEVIIPEPVMMITDKASTITNGSGSAKTEDGVSYVRYTPQQNKTLSLTWSVSLNRAQARYVVIKYRASNTATSTPTISYSWKNGSKSVNLDKSFPSSWKTIVIDMGAGTEILTGVTLNTGLNKKQNTLDIVYFAFFAEKDDADKYANVGNSGSQTTGTQAYNLGSNQGFGLLYVNGYTYNSATGGYFTDATWVNGVGENALLMDGSTLYRNKPASGSDYTRMAVTLNSGAIQYMMGGYIRADLVEAKLGANGKPVYTKGTVDYLANYMALTLTQPMKDVNGALNMWYVMGDKVFGDKDLADKLRDNIKGNVGSYEEAKAKYDAGQLTHYEQVTSYYDAAYFLLHNLFADSEGYGKTVTEYTTLDLVQKTDANGKTFYTFNSKYNGVVYDKATGVIYNSQTDEADIRQRDGEDLYANGEPLPENSFNPAYGLGYATAEKPGSNATYEMYCAKYLEEDKDNLAYYEKANFNYTVEGHAEFIYHQDDDLYFTFSGDDDVYLYINGVRVLDLGATHQLVEVTINLNDVAEICELHDGEIYTFDFFYMERHGSAANFGIETNIKIVDPSMVTEKRAWQDGNQIGYNGFVKPNTDIVYDFSITNNGQTSISELTFHDVNLGVYFSKDTVKLPEEGTSITDIAVYHFAADGSIKAYTNPANMTEEILKSYLTSDYKILVGEKLLIYGVKHVLDNTTADQFDNYVYTTAVADGQNVEDAKRNLNGMDNHRVQKTRYAFDSLEFYDGGHLSGEGYGLLDENKSFGVTITLDELLAPMKAKADLKDLNYAGAVIQLTNASGTSTNVKYNATVNADGSIFFQTDKTGTELFYYTVTIGDYTYEPIAVHVYTYGVADNIYVLDYNLPVDLDIERNDVLSIGSNPNTAYTYAVSADSLKGTYGDFNAASDSLGYTMKQFMNGLDTLEVVVTVLKNGATEVSKTTGVTLTQTVTVAPANVMYYEDDFTGEGAITYVNTGSDASGNIWAVYEAEEVGDKQSADQDMNYGSDPNYAENKNDLYVSDLYPAYLEGIEDKALLGSVSANIFGKLWGVTPTEEDILCLEGDASNGTIHAMAINNADAAVLMSFDFTGTGFEIVGRTTMYAYAVVTVVITDLDTGAMMAIPVITECVSGDLYQVPFVARKGLAYGNYNVQLISSNVNRLDRMIYVDGVRVYQPLDEDLAATIYKENESVAEFYEIKEQILAGNVVYGSIAEIEETDGALIKWNFGNTMIENFRPEDAFGQYTLVNTESYDDYMQYGPNNEIYLSNVNGARLSYIAFYVVLDENYEGERSIQVGAHVKSTVDAYTGGRQIASLRYGNNVEDFLRQDNAVMVSGGTEQYYTVDIAWNPVNNNGIEQTLVIIGIDNADSFEVLSLTNIKLNGYKIAGNTAAEMTAVQDMYDINASILMSRIVAIGEAIVNKD